LGNVGVIADFKPGTDRIVLDDAVFKALGSRLSPGAFYSKAGATKAHDADDRIIYDRASGRLFYDDDGNRSGGHAPVHFATLGSKLTLDVDDFVIV
jgi:Ca2+-binding RTX toxin-like protein